MSALMVRSNAAAALWWAAALTLALYFIPYGRYLLWPLLLFSTLMHELGHGLMALVMGGRFASLQMWPNGSGLASHAGHYNALEQAAIAAGGLLGPAVAALFMFLGARRRRSAQAALLLLSLLLLAAAVLWVRNIFGLLYVAVTAGLLLWLAVRGSAAAAQMATVFLAIQLSLSVFARSDYLFTAKAQTGGGTLPSDVAHIAQALWLPYWFWGGLIAALSLLLLWVGTRAFLRAT